MKLLGWTTRFAYRFKGLIDCWCVEVGSNPLTGYLIGDHFSYDFYDLTSEEYFQEEKDFKLCNCFYFSFAGVLLSSLPAVQMITIYHKPLLLGSLGLQISVFVMDTQRVN